MDENNVVELNYSQAINNESSLLRQENIMARIRQVVADRNIIDVSSVPEDLANVPQYLYHLMADIDRKLQKYEILSEDTAVLEMAKLFESDSIYKRYERYASSVIARRLKEAVMSDSEHKEALIADVLKQFYHLRDVLKNSPYEREQNLRDDSMEDSSSMGR